MTPANLPRVSVIDGPNRVAQAGFDAEQPRVHVGGKALLVVIDQVAAVQPCREWLTTGYRYLLSPGSAPGMDSSG